VGAIFPFWYRIEQIVLSACLGTGNFFTNMVHMKNYIVFLIVFTVVFVSRLPFLDAGYGNEQDGWRVAAAARYIGTTGEYKASRLPGFPVVEFACSLVWNYGAWAMNVLTALTSAITAGMLSLIAKRYGVRDPILIALTFSFIPIVFINSTVTMDYLWAMMFVMFGWYAGLNEKPVIAGLFLGIAIGCRITTVLFILPFTFLFLVQRNWRSHSPKIIRSWIATGLVGAFAYLPVFLSYGTHFITGFKRGGLPSFINIVRFIFNDVWGPLGFITIVSAALLIFRNRKKRIDSSILQTISIDHRKIWYAVLIIYAIAFALHPMKGAYVIPAIPFLLFLFASYLTRVQFFITCSIIILSSFIVNIDLVDLPWSPIPSPFSSILYINDRAIAIDLRGAIFNDHLKRINNIHYIQAVFAQTDTIHQPSVVNAGSWLPYIVLATPGALPESEYVNYSLTRRNVEFVDVATHEMLNQFHQDGLTLWYLPRVNERSKLVNDIDLEKEGALKLTPAKLYPP
jgi:hypothetical protein